MNDTCYVRCAQLLSSCGKHALWAAPVKTTHHGKVLGPQTTCHTLTDGKVGATSPHCTACGQAHCATLLQCMQGGGHPKYLFHMIQYPVSAAAPRLPMPHCFRQPSHLAPQVVPHHAVLSSGAGAGSRRWRRKEDLQDPGYCCSCQECSSWMGAQASCSLAWKPPALCLATTENSGFC